MLHLMDHAVKIREVSRRIERNEQLSSDAKPLKKVRENKHRRFSPNVAVVTKRGGVATRYNLEAKVIIEKNDRYLNGYALNISSSGLFVKTNKRVFRDSETIRLKIRPRGGRRFYKAVAEVVRFNEDSRYPSGYGLRFISPRDA